MYISTKTIKPAKHLKLHFGTFNNSSVTKAVHIFKCLIAVAVGAVFHDCRTGASSYMKNLSIVRP